MSGADLLAPSVGLDDEADADVEACPFDGESDWKAESIVATGTGPEMGVAVAVEEAGSEVWLVSAGEGVAMLLPPALAAVAVEGSEPLAACACF